MQNLSTESIINAIKNAYKWKNDESIKVSKLVLTNFSDFIKLRFLPKKDIATTAFTAFVENPTSERAEGKLEAWIEIALDEKHAIEELQEKLKNLEDFYKKNISDEKEEEINPSEEIEGLVEEHDEEVENELAAKRPIIVPWDFSEVAEHALEHAVLFAKSIGRDIYLLHLTKHDKEIEKAKDEMNKVADEALKKFKIKPEVMVQTGSIVKSITEIANENNASFVIMGTHGIKGMQKFTGSLALKVIAGTHTPFIVVQEAPKVDVIRSIVYPMDHSKECKQMLKQVNQLAKLYKLKINLTVPERLSTDKMRKDLASNLNFTRGYLTQHKIEFEVFKYAKASSSSDAVLKHLADHKPDMVMVLTTKNINIQDYVLGADEQKVIANKYKVPVMCVNPMKAKLSVLSVHGIA